MQALQITLTKVTQPVPMSALPKYLREGAVEYPFRCSAKAPECFRPNAFPNGELTRTVDLMKHYFHVDFDFQNAELFYNLTTSTSAFTAYKMVEEAYKFFETVCRAVNDSQKAKEN